MWAYMILIGKRKVLIWNCKGEKKEREFMLLGAVWIVSINDTDEDKENP